MNHLELTPMPEESKYAILHERGCELSDDDLDIVLEEVSGGIVDTEDYLVIPPVERTLGIIFSDAENRPDLVRPGYLPAMRAVNLPIPYLNMLARAGRPVRDQVGVRLRSGYLRLSRFLRATGREEATHHYQFIGHPRFKAKLPVGYAQASQLDQMLCASEVEARNTVDAVAIWRGEFPLYTEVECQLRRNYPERYGKTLAPPE